MTPEEGRYPSPITWHCESLPVVAMFMLSLFVGTREVAHRHPCITPEGHVLCWSKITREKAEEMLWRGTKYGQK